MGSSPPIHLFYSPEGQLLNELHPFLSTAVTSSTMNHSGAVCNNLGFGGGNCLSLGGGNGFGMGAGCVGLGNGFGGGSFSSGSGRGIGGGVSLGGGSCSNIKFVSSSSSQRSYRK